MKRILFFLTITLAAFILFFWQKYKSTLTQTAKTNTGRYLVTGTGNPGHINLYTRTDNGYTLEKTIDTGFQFVHTVRFGDIYNDGKLYIVAGVSNSFYRDPYGCQVVTYDINTFQKRTIDDVGDLRCKDLTIGDADNDGKNEIILGTHGEGLVNIYTWTQQTWQKTVLETNYIAQIDAERHTDHLVPNTDVPCQTCLIQTAVHIVKIGDIDNDGKNEIVTTMSSPLELKTGEEISFIRVYRKSGDAWSGQTIDSLTGREFRSITIADVHGNGKNTLLVGIGTPKKNPGSLIAYDFQDSSWHKSVVHQDQTELNMKGVDVGNINGIARSILLATGFPNANILAFHWTGTRFTQSDIGSVHALFDLPDAQFNTMVASIIPDPHTTFLVAGNTLFPKQNLGWEATTKGFLIQYADENGKWVPTILNTQNVLGFDIL